MGTGHFVSYLKGCFHDEKKSEAKNKPPSSLSSGDPGSSADGPCIDPGQKQNSQMIDT
jgi:hypothetical protein